MANKEEENLLFGIQTALKLLAAVRSSADRLSDRQKGIGVKSALMCAEENLKEASTILMIEVKPETQEKTHTAFSLRPSEGELPV